MIDTFHWLPGNLTSSFDRCSAVYTLFYPSRCFPLPFVGRCSLNKRVERRSRNMHHCRTAEMD